MEKTTPGSALTVSWARLCLCCPRSLLQKYIRLKRIKLNGKGSKRDTRLNEGDVLSLYINDEFFEKPHASDNTLPQGRRAQARHRLRGREHHARGQEARASSATARAEWDYNTLIANIQAYAYQKGEWRPREENAFAPALCNRIDRNTGGIVIAAKNAEALRIINEKIKEREIEKYYLCVVHGAVRSLRRASCAGYIFKDAAKNRVYVRQKPEPGAKDGRDTTTAPSPRRGRPLPRRVPPGHGQDAPDKGADGRRRHPPSRATASTASDRENKKLGEERPAALLLPPRISPSRPTPEP